MRRCAVNAAAAAKCRLSLSRIGLFSVRRAGRNGSLGVNGRRRVKEGFGACEGCFDSENVLSVRGAWCGKSG